MLSRIYSRSSFCFIGAAIIFSSCTAKDKVSSKEINSKSKAPSGVISSQLPTKETRAVYRDKAGILWITTDGYGICRYDGKNFTTFTVKDGISHNSTSSISEDENGNLWFSSAKGLTRYDGISFTAITEESGQLPKTIYGRKAETISGAAWKSITSTEQIKSYKWFGVYGGVNRYDGTSFTFFPLPDAPNEKQFEQIPPSSILNAYSGYCTLVDREGNLWVGTELRGVCRFDGKNFIWFNEKHLGGAAARALYQDNKGNIWMGNNGGGLFRYDGNAFINVAEELKLTNKAFLRGEIVQDELGTMSRIFSITGDNDGNVWVGSIDAGAWRYDGKTWTNFTTADGLPSNRICNIYKDKTGLLWFSSVSDGICTYDGKEFKSFGK